jgi:hypothetical protein
LTSFEVISNDNPLFDFSLSQTLDESILRGAIDKNTSFLNGSDCKNG